MLVSDFMDRMTAITGWPSREIDLYARRLREGGLFPDRTSVRKVPIALADAVNLLVALMASDSARQAVEAVKLFGELRAEPVQPEKTLSGFLQMVLKKAHADAALRRRLFDGRLSVVRRPRAARFADSQNKQLIGFFPDGNQIPGRAMALEMHLQGRALMRLSYELADIPVPQHIEV
jgi:hypothetical protein